MKKLIYLLCTLLIVACNGNQKPDSPLSSVNTDTAKQDITQQQPALATPPASIAEIKNSYVNTVAKLKSKTLDSVALRYNCRQEKSGTITYFRDQGKIVLIKHVYAEYDHNEAVDQYFMRDSVLYFAYFKRMNWSFDSSTGTEGATKDNITESRFYLIDGQSVSCLEKKYTIYSGSLDKVLPESIPNRSIKCGADKKLTTTVGKLVNYQNQKNGDCFE